MGGEIMSDGAKKRLSGVRKARPGGKGWSDNDAMRALDKRMQLDSPDGSLTVWQDAAGYHAQAKRKDLSVAWDSDAEVWNIRVPTLIGADPAHAFVDHPDGDNGTYKIFMAYSAGLLQFKKHTTDYTVSFCIDIATHNWLRWKANIADADATADALTLLEVSAHGFRCGAMTRQIFSIRLNTDGTWAASKFNTAPSDVSTPRFPLDGAYFSYAPDTRTLTLTNIMQASGLTPGYGSTVIPASSTDLSIVYGRGYSASDAAYRTDLYYTGDPDITMDKGAWIVASITTDADGICTSFSDSCRGFQFREEDPDDIADLAALIAIKTELALLADDYGSIINSAASVDLGLSLTTPWLSKDGGGTYRMTFADGILTGIQSA